MTFIQEYWCKRQHPHYVCERVFRQPPLKESLKKGRLKKQDFVVTKHKHVLLQAADFLGQKMQYNCAGFLSNRRQVIDKLLKSLNSFTSTWVLLAGCPVLQLAFCFSVKFNAILHDIFFPGKNLYPSYALISLINLYVYVVLQ